MQGGVNMMSQAILYTFEKKKKKKKANSSVFTWQED